MYDMYFSRFQRCVSLSLAALLLVGNLMQFSFYAFALDHIKHEMQRELFTAQNDLTTLEFNAADFSKVSVNGGELCVNGSWFDISSIVSANGKVKVKCLADNDESLINSWMKKVVNDHSSDNGKQKNTLSANAEYIPAHGCSIASNEFTLVNESLKSVVSDEISGFQSLPELPPRA